MSSNLPPGISESSLPGNRPEDAAHERYMEQLAGDGDAIVNGQYMPSSGQVDPLYALAAVIEFVRVDTSLPDALDRLLDEARADIESLLDDNATPND